MSRPILTLWHDLDHDGDTSVHVVEKLCADFSARANCDVVTESMSMFQLQDRLSHVHSRDDAPEMALVPADLVSLRTYAQLSVVPSHLQALIGASLADSMRTAGQVYGVPLLRGNHLVVFYNHDRLPSAPTTWEGLAACRPDLASRGCVPIAADLLDPYWFIPFLTGHGGWVLRGTEPDLNTQACRQSLAFLAEQVAAGVLLHHDALEEMLDEFVAGHTAAIIAGEWVANYLIQKMGSSLGVGPMPTIAGHTAAIIAGEWVANYLIQKMGSSLGVGPMPTIAGRAMQSMSSSVGLIYPKQSLTGPKGDLVAGFTEFVLSDESQAEWVTSVQRWPAKAGLEIDRDALDENSLAIMDLVPDCRPMPLDDVMLDVWFAMRLALERLLAGRCSPAEAAALMHVCARSRVAGQMAAQPEPKGESR